MGGNSSCTRTFACRAERFSSGPPRKGNADLQILKRIHLHRASIRCGCFEWVLQLQRATAVFLIKMPSSYTCSFPQQGRNQPYQMRFDSRCLPLTRECMPH